MVRFENGQERNNILDRHTREFTSLNSAWRCFIKQEKGIAAAWTLINSKTETEVRFVAATTHAYAYWANVDQRDKLNLIDSNTNIHDLRVNYASH